VQRSKAVAVALVQVGAFALACEESLKPGDIACDGELVYP